MTAASTETPKAPVKAMWICMALGWVFFLLPIPGTVFIAGPLNVAAFILAIVCLIRSRVGQGVIGLAGTTVVSAIIYFIGLALLGAGLAGAATEGARIRQEQTVNEVTTAVNTVNVTATQLVSDYEANEVAADGKYKGKILEISGVIDSISKDVLNTPQIILSSGRNDTFRSIQCSFAANQEGELAVLAKGKAIVIRGKCNGLMGNVLIEGSMIVK